MFKLVMLMRLVLFWMVESSSSLTWILYDGFLQAMLVSILI